MASLSAGDDDDYFEEYNPHPFQGGYDITLTYGSPLSPSPSTCYPISNGSGHRPEPLLSPPVSDHRPEPLASPPHPSPPPLEPDHHPEPYEQPPLYDYGYSGHRPECYWPELDVLGFWPPVCGSEIGGGADVEEVGYWSQWKRAGYYLFGYSQGYGERRIGVDSYGIPVYANKRGVSEAVNLQIEQARDSKVVFHENDSWSLTSYERKGESYGYAYNKYHHMEPLHVEEKLTETTLHQRSTYHDAYEEQAYTKPEWWFPTSHEMKDESYGYAYNKYQYTKPLHIEENSTETMLHQRLTYYDFDEEQGCPKSEWWFSSYDATKDQSCSYAYNKYNYMEPLHDEENFMDPMLHQRLTYHDTEEHTYPKQSSYSEFGENNFHVDHQYSCERPTNEQPLSFELEPYKPTWSQNLNHQEYYGGELSLESFNSSVENGWCESNTFGDPNNAYKCHYSDQPLQIQLEPFKPAWAQNSTLNEPYIQEGSPSSCVSM